MKMQLNSIEQVPAWLPPWQAIMEDLAYPPAPRVAKVLGLGERSVVVGASVADMASPS